MSDQQLLQQFVASFQRLDDLIAPDGAPPELLVEQDVDEWDHWQADLKPWRPQQFETSLETLTPLYSRMGGVFPLLYERLVLSFRWLEVDLKLIRLFANPPGPDFTGLTMEIFPDQIMADTLIPAGFIPFARSSINYDPICFDLNAMTAQRDCPILQFEHEAILCQSKIGEHWQRWNSVRDLMSEIIFLDCE
ncbi:hypothetical protein Pan241w_00350 [Gimesia alba]|uniref:SMI1 / KNR4 family protein n=1 Tax=Gimesia alba TaxID=2527973 RepID=A0A517R7Z4_9PLAN|nr:hypothetical protein [Gimesia alba]QDT39982.1 hypothetical protein Pan241w_00350 [Gimesia alba]